MNVKANTWTTLGTMKGWRRKRYDIREDTALECRYRIWGVPLPRWGKFTGHVYGHHIRGKVQVKAPKDTTITISIRSI